MGKKYFPLDRGQVENILKKLAFKLNVNQEQAMLNGKGMLRGNVELLLLTI